MATAPPPPDAADLAWLTGEQARALLGGGQCDPSRPLESLAWLRRQVTPARAALLLTQARLRDKATLRFPAPLTHGWLFDDLALQQASSWPAATHKAARIARTAPPGPIGDLACGFGADALAIALAGRAVVAVDADAARLALLAANARATAAAAGRALDVQTRTATITAADRLDDVAAWHCDPDRRPGRGSARAYDLDHATPDRATLEALLARHPHAAIKGPPGLEVEPLGWPADAEWISEGGELKQVVLWLGTLRGAEQVTRRATGLPAVRHMQGMDWTRPPAAWTVVATAADDRTWPAPAEELGPCVYEPDAAVIRADLVGVLARRHSLRPVHPRICYLSGPACAAAGLTRFDLRATLPAEPRRLAAELSTRRWRGVEVLCRGVDLDTTHLQAALNRAAQPAHDPVSVLVTRLAAERNRVVALVGRRVAAE